MNVHPKVNRGFLIDIKSVLAHHRPMNNTTEEYRFLSKRVKHVDLHVKIIFDQDVNFGRFSLNKLNFCSKEFPVKFPPSTKLREVSM